MENKKGLDPKSEEQKIISLDAEELLSAEMSEIEGGAQSGCSSCSLFCYSDFW